MNNRWINYDKSAAFWVRVDQNGECLEWTGARNRYGYKKREQEP